MRTCIVGCQVDLVLFPGELIGYADVCQWLVRNQQNRKQWLACATNGTIPATVSLFQHGDPVVSKVCDYMLELEKATLEAQ